MCFKEATRNMVVLCMCECECLCSNAGNEPCSQTSRALSRKRVWPARAWLGFLWNT
jgi:hypothetical protein